MTHAWTVCLLVACVSGLTLTLAGCANEEPPKVNQDVVTPSGLTYRVVRGGEGPGAQNGQTVSVNYVGKFKDGKVFDSSKRPFTFVLGKGKVIRGWDEGLLGMQRGEHRILVIPPDLAYGAAGSAPAIPPNSTLYFEVQMLEIK